MKTKLIAAHLILLVGLVGVTLGLFFGVVLASGVKNPEGQSQKPLIAIIPQDFLPTYFRDSQTGKPTGLAVDLTNALVRRAGLKVEYRFGEPWEEIEQELLSGRADLIPLRVINSKTSKRFIFTERLDATPVNYIVRASDRGPAPGQKVGVIEGSTADVYLKEQQDINVIPYDSMQHLFMDLISGQLDLVLTVPKSLLELADKADLEGRVRVIEPPAFEVTRAIALAPNNTALRDRLNRAIDALEGTKEQQDIYRRWLGAPKSWWTAKRVGWTLGAALAFISVGLTGWRLVGMRRLNRRLRAERTFLQTLMDAIPEPIFYKDKESVYLGCNDFFARAFIGLPKSQIIGKTDLDFVKDRKLAEFFRQKDREALAAEKSCSNDEWITLADGRSILVETIKVPFRTESGEIGGLIGIARDVTGRDVKEKLHSEARERLQTILDSLTTRVAVLDAQGTIVVVNQAWKDFAQTNNIPDPDAHIGLNYLEVCEQALRDTPDAGIDAVLHGLREVLIGSMSYFEQEYSCHSPTAKYWFNMVVTPWHAPEGGAVVSHRDITKRRQVEEALRERVKELACLSAVRRESQEDLSSDAFCQRVVEHLVPAMQFPEITVPVIEIQDKRYTTANFTVELAYNLHSEIRVYGKLFGHLRVYYSQVRPFLIPEEQNLIDGVAESISLWFERHLAEESLRLTQENLELALQGADLGTWVWQVKTGAVMFNERWAEMLGYRLDEIEPHVSSWEKLLHPEDLPTVMKVLTTHLNGETRFYETEHRLQHKSGNWIWVLDKGKVIERDAAGRAVRACGTHLDITARKTAEAVLKEQAAFRAAVIDNTTEGLAVCHDINEFPFVKFTVWNPRMVEITGYSMEEINRSGWYQTVYPDPDLQARARDRMARMRQGDNLKGEEWEITRGDGEKRILRISSSTLAAISGEAHVLALMVDVTDSKRAQDILRESEERFRTLMESVPGISIQGYDTEGTVHYWNQASEAVYGYTATEAIGRNLGDLIIPAEIKPHFEKALVLGSKATLSGELMPPGEVSLLHKNNSRVPVYSIHSVVCQANRPPMMFCIDVDLSERKRAEEEIIRQREELRGLASRLAEVEEVERKKLAGEIHDNVCQNLASIGIDLEILKAKAAHEPLDRWLLRLENASKLIEQTGGIARNIMEGLRPTVLDSYGLMGGLHQIADQFSQQTGIDLKVQESEPGVRFKPEVELALFRIAQEALHNVAKHARASHVVVTEKLDQDTIRLIIADDGVGFDPKPMTTPKEGHGWGLITMNERAKGVGGTCRIESQPGQGTHVVVEVPR